MVTRLAHMGIQVNDYRKAQEFFCDGLGMEPIYTGSIGEFKHILDPSVDPASDPREQMGYLRICRGQYFEMFEGIVEPPEFDPKPIYAYEDMAFVEVGLGVADLEDAVRRITANGLTVKEDCVFDPDGNRFRLIPVGGPVGEHIIVRLAYVAQKVNDIRRAVEFYTQMGLKAHPADEKGNVEMRLSVGSMILVKSDTPVVRHSDTALFHLAYGTDSFRELQETADQLAAVGVPSYRNLDKKDILRTAPDQFDPDQGPDGTIGIRVFDPDDNFCELIYMPEDNRQNVFEREHPFEPEGDQ